ncbi:type I-E CRISPR-associated protein Cas6/Cse3/CasE [Victivallis sp. Marseille-Q1083]|uniref:type I-E CRISPR-associated protein Cas6/Cse3/CasE n=1 Tax=Victivallis sp. Marseille-Q1083 TaxID=2717288 RepID=UPI00158AD0FF|nr:type I-E CRISPR-associated protein Cas6/Cse3/CasE [Victivallis sp. Marseille-Q1083]
MFLTKLLLDVKFCRQEKISDAYGIHRTVYSMFPPQEGSQRILYADRGPRRDGREIVILSGVQPELPPDVQASTLRIGERFFAAREYRFEVLLNPVKCNPKTRKREPVIGQLPLLNWFVGHAEQWGFQADPETLELFVRPSLSFVKGGHAYRLHSVQFRGVLRVTAPERFRQSFTAGLGHGKAFGFGLLQLMPVQQ